MRFPDLLAVVVAAVTWTATTAAAQTRSGLDVEWVRGGGWDVEWGGGWNVPISRGDLSDFRGGPAVEFGATKWAGDWGIGVKASGGVLLPRRDREHEHASLFAFLVFRHRFTCGGECILTGSITGVAFGVPALMPIPGMLIEVTRRIEPRGWKLTATDDVKLYVGARVTGFYFLITPTFSISW